MVKALDAPYAAGRRGRAWQKVKPVHTLDLVVLGAEWGYGRRTGTLSNIHLGARDPDGGEPIMVGKTFKGMTDALLAWQTGDVPASTRASTGRNEVLLRPELVVEIALDGAQRSTRYPGGVALRFARVSATGRTRPRRTPTRSMRSGRCCLIAAPCRSGGSSCRRQVERDAGDQRGRLLTLDSGLPVQLEQAGVERDVVGARGGPAPLWWSRRAPSRSSTTTKLWSGETASSTVHGRTAIRTDSNPPSTSSRSS